MPPSNCGTPLNYVRPAAHVFMYCSPQTSHLYQSKRIRDRTQQNDQHENGSDIPDHDTEDLLAAEGMSVHFYFLFDALKAYTL